MNRFIALRMLGCVVGGLLCANLAVAQTPNTADEAPASGEVDIIFSSSALQAGLEGTGDLGALAQENSALGDTASAYGFSAKSDEANVFLVGALYSEALAFLRSGDEALAADRLEALQDQLLRVGASSSLYALVGKTLNLVQRGEHSTAAQLDMLSLFQPFFEDYASGRSQDFLILFRAGSWLVDLGIAAAAGNTALLHQEAHLGYIVRELERMDAPKGVQDALEQISGVAAKETITSRDTKTVVAQVKRIQGLLG